LHRAKCPSKWAFSDYTATGLSQYRVCIIILFSPGQHAEAGEICSHTRTLRTGSAGTEGHTKPFSQNLKTVSMAVTKLSNNEKKDLAKALYLQGQYTLKDIAEKVGIAEKTISGKDGWVQKEGWDKMRKSLTTTKAEQLAFLYDILAKMTEDGKKALEDDDPKTNPDYDGISKISKAIERLEKETNVGEMIQTFILFLKFLRTENMDLAKQFNHWSMIFIQDQMAKAK
jgi:transposase-like protein